MPEKALIISSGTLRSRSIGLGFDRAEEFAIFEDFLNSSAMRDFTTTISSGAVNNNGAEGNHPGVIQLSTSTSASGAVHLATGTDQIVLGGGIVTFDVCLYLPNISSSGQRFWSRIGLMDGTGGASEPANGVYFRSKDDVNSHKWEIVTRSASSESAADSGSSVSTSWTRFTGVVNAGATSVEFFINGTSVGTRSSQIPSAGMGLAASICKTVGTTARTMRVDYAYCNIDFTSAR